MEFNPGKYQVIHITRSKNPVKSRYFMHQGRRRVLKSGPAEEIIECRRHERGRAREGDPSPLSLGGLPRENFEFLALLCAF